jgi:hypothetical protein
MKSGHRGIGSPQASNPSACTREVIHVNVTLRVPRSRGAVSGAALILLGLWGALIPLVGPYFHYAYTPDTGWTYTSGRFWLEILPGAGTLVGGLMMLVSSYRPIALLGGWLAALSGGWFAVGSLLAPTWAKMGVTAGQPVGGTMLRAVEQLGFFTGLGIVIVFFATLTLGRLSVVSVRDTKLAAGAMPKQAEPAEEKPADEEKPAEPKAARTGMRFPGLPRGRSAAETEKPAGDRVRSAAR